MMATEHKDNLRVHRARAGLTQAALAEKSGVSEISIRKYESGDQKLRNAQVGTLLKLVEALDTTISDIDLD